MGIASRMIMYILVATNDDSPIIVLIAVLSFFGILLIVVGIKGIIKNNDNQHLFHHVIRVR